VPLPGVTYDPKSDILEIALDGLERLVSKPQQIFVDVRGAGLDSFEVIDSRWDPPYPAAPRATHASSAAKGWRLTVIANLIYSGRQIVSFCPDDLYS
jgi:hypothetical protein